MLTSQQEQLWRDYQAVESRGTRDAKIQALEPFTASLSESPIVQWESWAREIARRVVDDKEDMHIRMPLFRAVVFPALLKGYRDQLPGCARWLAGLSQHLSRCSDCRNQLPEEERTETGLRWTAIRHDPTDHSSRQWLIDHLRSHLQNSLHDIPLGVLYGMDGATADQCLELEGGLQEFVELVQQQNQLDRFRSLIDDCRFHFREYRNYPLRSDAFEDYPNYLNRLAN